MATDIEINTKIETATSAKSLAELRKALKDLISLQSQVGAGSANFDKLRKTINDTEGKMGDLTDSFQTLRGSGVERLNSSLGLLRESFTTADPGKLKIAFEGLSASMKAIPIFLIIEAVRALFNSFESLSKSGGLLGETFIFISKQIEGTRENFKRFTDDIGLTNHAEEELKEKRLMRLKGEATAIEKRYDFEIKMAQASGKETIQIEREKVAAIAASVSKQVEYYQQLQKEGTKLTDAQLKDVRELTSKLNSLVEERKLAEEKYRVEALKKEKERLEKEKEAGRLKGEEFNRLLGLQKEYEEAVNASRIADEQQANQKIIDAYKAGKETERAINDLFSTQDKEAETESEKDRRLKSENRLAFEKAFLVKSTDQKIEAIQKERDTLLQNEQLTQEQRIKIIEDSEQKIFQLKVQKAQEFLNYAQQANQIANSFAQIQTQNENYEIQQRQYAKDASVQNDSNRTQEQLEMEEMRKEALLDSDKLTAKQREIITRESEKRKNEIERASKATQDSLNKEFAAKELEIRKNQFERNKTMQTVTGLINTAASVLQTLASAPYPANIPLAALAAAVGFAQVAVIQNQKFDDGGAAAQSTINPVASSSGSAEPPPNFTNAGISPIRPDDPDGNIVRQSERTNSATQKVVVLESEITETSNRVQVFEDRRTFG